MSKVVHTGDIGDSLIKDYVDLFSTYSFKNELYAKVSLHVIIGQLLSKPILSPDKKSVRGIPVYYMMGSRKLDTRLHLLLIKPQGTGKGAGFGFVERMARALGLDFQSLTEATDAGLVGTLDKDEEGNRVILEGLLASADIIGMEEASVLFDLSSDFSKKNMTYMQITMNALSDSSCFISKKLGPEMIEFKPHASFLLLTYPPDKLVDKLLKTGFMDRIICVFENVTLEDRLHVIKTMSEHINKMTKKDYDKDFDSVRKRLGRVVEFWTKNQNSNTCVEIPKEVHGHLIDVIDEFSRKILDASPKAREKLEHFVSRLYEVLIKLSVHHAILDMRKTLNVSDVMYARMLYMPIWKNLIISVESLLIISDIERHRRYRIVRQSLEEYDRIVREEKFPHVRDKVWVRRLTMIENLQVKWDHCSMETASNSLEQLEKHHTNEEMDKTFGRVSKGFHKDKFFERKTVGSLLYLKKIRDLK